MEHYQKRVVEEKRELDEKLAKLDAFRRTKQFLVLSTSEQARMHHQGFLMASYSRVLGERIEAFPSA